MMHHVNSDCNRPISLTLILTLSLSFVRQGYGVGVLSLSLSLHFAGRGPAPRRLLPRLGGGRGFGVSRGRSLSPHVKFSR